MLRGIFGCGNLKMFEDAKVAIRSDNVTGRQYNDQKKKTNTANKVLHRFLLILVNSKCNCNG
jgi:hypothetical protein